VFSATMSRERNSLGDDISAWRKENPEFQMVDTVITQSSDSKFHCLAITVFYKDPKAS
jgi:hypothetical protein